MPGLKGAYLKKLTSQLRMRSVSVGKELDGSTPPSVFIGSWNYPKVLAGPMLTPSHGDTSIIDTPEQWIPAEKTTPELVQFRMSLVRGKREVGITDTSSHFVEKLQNISLSDSSLESQVEFDRPPTGSSFSDEHLPYGPSAGLESFEVSNCRWDSSLEKVYYDTDLKAAPAVFDLYERGVEFSRIQKAFSVGTMGLGRNRRLVPTRWSITACDTTLGNRLLDEVRHNAVIDHVEVREFYSLNNYYAVILLPTTWQYEWSEAFLHVMGDEEALFSDFETNRTKRGYSSVGGCYYSCKFGVLEGLARDHVQAGAIVLREAYPGYVPLGVFNVRENVRAAMAQTGHEFDSLRQALDHLKPKLRLPLSRFVNESTILRDQLRGSQTTLGQFN